MKKQKLFRTMFFAALVLVIVASVALPAILASYRENKLLSHLGSLENNISAPDPSDDIRSKLMLISDHSSGARAITLTEQKNIISSGGENAVLSVAVGELKMLADRGLLPSLPPTAPAENAVCSAATYVDPKDPDRRVTVWKLSFSADGHLIELWMDALTHTVYCVSFSDTSFSLSRVNALGLCNSWGSYLGLENGTAAVTQEGFSANYDGLCFEFSDIGQSVFIRLSPSEFGP